VAARWLSSLLALEITTAGRSPKRGIEVRELIRQMSIANPPWGAPRIYGELLKLGIDVGQTSLAKYMARTRRPPSQGWKRLSQSCRGDSKDRRKSTSAASLWQRWSSRVIDTRLNRTENGVTTTAEWNAAGTTGRGGECQPCTVRIPLRPRGNLSTVGAGATTRGAVAKHILLDMSCVLIDNIRGQARMLASGTTQVFETGQRTTGRAQPR
jgi:hypothetical protein